MFPVLHMIHLVTCGCAFKLAKSKVQHIVSYILLHDITLLHHCSKNSRFIRSEQPDMIILSPHAFGLDYICLDFEPKKL